MLTPYWKEATMNLTVIGATGKTGIEVVKQALEHNHHVTAFVRDPTKLNLQHEQLNVVTGNVLDVKTLEPAIKGQDAVICALGATSLGKIALLSEGTHNIITTMQKHTVKRLIVMTAIGVHESWKQLNWFAKVFFILMLKNLKVDHERQEDIVRASGLEYIIVRPGRLTNGRRTANYTFGTDPSIKSGSVSRADVADFMLKQLEGDDFVGKAVAVT